VNPALTVVQVAQRRGKTFSTVLYYISTSTDTNTVLYYTVTICYYTIRFFAKLYFTILKLKLILILIQRPALRVILILIPMLVTNMLQ